VAQGRHKRETTARRFPRAVVVGVPTAALVTAATVATGVALHTPDKDGGLVASSALQDLSSAIERPDQVSRSSTRMDRQTLRALGDKQQAYDRELAQAERKRLRQIVTAALDRNVQRWTTTDLDLWTAAGKDAKQSGELTEGKKVVVTGRSADGRVEIILDGKALWVTAGYLSDEKPIAAAAGLSMEPCPDPSVENGLTDGAVYVYRSVCHAFPQITSYGGWDNHGEHASGRALDIMTSDVELGNAIAEFLQSHAAELNLYDILWRQHIWTPERASEGWRAMSSRGSATANHYDHVHVAVY